MKNREPQPPRLPEVLGDYAARNPARFHMPGHKARGMGGFWRAELIGWDVTELSPTDDLHCPEGVLKRAQEDCARTFGAAESFFLVNGSTAGVLAMLLSLPRESKILLGRDCHRSALSGAALAGHDCRFVSPPYEEAWGLHGMVTAEALDRALSDFPADAVLLTSPNFYGLSGDIAAWAEAAHRHGALLFVDAAHGAHFPFGKSFPEHPAGLADLWVHSAHKTLNALGQAAILHRGKSCPIPAWRVQQALAMVQSSSPSYLLAASLDWARYSAFTMQDWDAQALRCRRFGKQAARLPGLRVLDQKIVGSAGVAGQDPTRLVIDVAERGISGFEAAKALEERNVFVEMADARRLVCICTPSDDPEWYDRLLEALQAMPYGRRRSAPVVLPAEYPERVMSMREAALHEDLVRVPLPEAAGRIGGEAAGPYPPGIALWTPGERIRQEDVDVLAEQKAQGGGTFGVREGLVAVVKEK